MYTLSDLGVSSSLIGSLSLANAELFTPYRVDNALSHKTKTNVTSCPTSVSESEVRRIQENAWGKLGSSKIRAVKKLK